MNRRHFLNTTMAVAAGAALPLTGWSQSFLAGSQNQGRPVFLDCDTANEVDDLFAIVRALKVPGWDIKGLASTQWQHHHSPDAEERIIWDLAMVQALMNPAWATERKVKTPPENRPRQIWVYTDIDEASMVADWWSIVPG
jgi:hypothetical protein